MTSTYYHVRPTLQPRRKPAPPKPASRQPGHSCPTRSHPHPHNDDFLIAVHLRTGYSHAHARGRAASVLEERLFAIHDANYNVTGIVDASNGSVVERFVESPYGTVTYLNPDWTTDTAGSDFYWDRVHQGLVRDPETGLVYNRARYLHTSLGRFTARDFIGYGDGMNLYQYSRSSPVLLTDAFGRTTALPAAAAQALTVVLAFATIHATYTAAMDQRNWAAAERAVTKVRDAMITHLGLDEKTVAKPWATKALEEIKQLRGDAVPVPVPVPMPVPADPPVEAKPITAEKRVPIPITIPKDRPCGPTCEPCSCIEMKLANGLWWPTRTWYAHGISPEACFAQNKNDGLTMVECECDLKLPFGLRARIGQLR